MLGEVKADWKNREPDRAEIMLAELGVYRYQTPRIKITYTGGRTFEGTLRSIEGGKLFLTGPNQEVLTDAIDKIELLEDKEATSKF